MPQSAVRLGDGIPAPIRAGFEDLRARLDIPDDYPIDAVRDAAEAVAGLNTTTAVDRTELDLVTIDPEGSTDLDQAVHIERRGAGFRVHYAIADLTRFVTPGGPLDAETHRRGVTLYAPHERTPLHPSLLCEDAASLLPGVDRPAVLWAHDLDDRGVVVATTVGRAVVRSRAQLSYADVQSRIDLGTAEESLLLLRDVGALRLALEVERGGVSLPLPDQEVVATSDGWRLTFRGGLPVEQWNAQISLMTGMAAAALMLRGGVGILRTLPPINEQAVRRLRHVACGLGIAWPEGTSYAAFVRTLDPGRPHDAAMLAACTSVFRGAGYAAFDGAPPDQPLHGAMNAPYAHCTAPLRRLVDRYVSQICLNLASGEQVPDWAREWLAELDGEMSRATRRASEYERGIIDLVEALVLDQRVGEAFDATVLDWDPERQRGDVQIADPAVQASVRADPGLVPHPGDRIIVVLEAVDLIQGRVSFVAR